MIRVIVDMVMMHKVAVVIIILLIMGLFLPRAKSWEAEIEFVSQGVSGVEERILALEEGIVDVAESVTSMEARIASIESNYVEFTNNINALTSKVEGSKADYTQRLDDLRDMWMTLHNDTTVSQATLETVLIRLAELEGGYPSSDTTVRLLISHNASDGFVVNCAWGAIRGNILRGQGITIGSSPVDLQGVKFYLKKVGSPSAVNLRIYNAGSDGLPVGNPIYTRSIDVTSWSATPAFYAFNVSYYPLGANTRYCIVIEDSDGDNLNRIEMGIMSGGQYTGGAWVQSSDGGNVWATIQGAECDGGFEIWGLTR